MLPDHPFALSVSDRAHDESTYRWTIVGGQSGIISSREAYATRREAFVAGNGALIRLIKTWQLGQVAT